MRFLCCFARPSALRPPIATSRASPLNDPNFFPIAVWLQSPANAAKYKAVGINLYVGLWRGPTEEQLADAQAARHVRRSARRTTAGLRPQGRPDDRRLDARRRARQRPVARARQGLRPADPAGEDRRGLPSGSEEADPDPPGAAQPRARAWPGTAGIGRGVRTQPPRGLPRVRQGLRHRLVRHLPRLPRPRRTSPASSGTSPTASTRLRKWTGDAASRVWNCIECTHISNPKAKATPAAGQGRGLDVADPRLARASSTSSTSSSPRSSRPACSPTRRCSRASPPSTSRSTNSPRCSTAPTITDAVRSSPPHADVPIDICRPAQRPPYLFAVAMRRGTTTATFTFKPSPPTPSLEVLGENRTLPIQMESSPTPSSLGTSTSTASRAK